MTIRLYWVETPDHDEDWFVVAKSARSARRFHEYSEGYDRGSATSTFVCRVPPAAEALLRRAQCDFATREAVPVPEVPQVPCWPHPIDEFLGACGGTVHEPPAGTPEKEAMREMMGVVRAVVTFGARTFAAGDVVANAFARLNGSDA